MVQQAPNTVILAEDEMSLYLQATVAQVWALRGQPPTVRADPQRAKTSFYGTLDLRSGCETLAPHCVWRSAGVVTESPDMNGAATVQHLERVLAAYPGKRILLLWDRASWHKGPLVRELLAANPQLEVLYFPVASPDLNPQEHVWKATRRAVSHNHAQRRLPELAGRFATHLRTQTFPSSFLDRYGFNALRPRFT